MKYARQDKPELCPQIIHIEELHADSLIAVMTDAKHVTNKSVFRPTLWVRNPDDNRWYNKGHVRAQAYKYGNKTCSVMVHADKPEPIYLSTAVEDQTYAYQLLKGFANVLHPPRS